MTAPRLTIGIPHLDRTELLARAIDSALAQTVPVRVIVMDQGQTGATLALMERYEDVRHVYRFDSEAKCLWDNWKAVADVSIRYTGGPEFFAWLQDDDVIFPTFAERVIKAFDTFKYANLYLAPLKLGISPELSYEVGGNFPWVPMNHKDRIPDAWEGQLLVPTMYFTGWSLSPGVAWRCGPAFRRALDMMPPRFDLFQERAILAATAYDGTFIADPVAAGLWIHHDGPGSNESYRQHGDQPRQTAVLVDWLDDLMDRTPRWGEVLLQWARIMHPSWVVGWINQLGVTQSEGKVGRYTDEVKALLLKSLEHRVQMVPIPDESKEAKEEAAWQPA
jgi:Glycosyl transferase family 2